VKGVVAAWSSRWQEVLLSRVRDHGAFGHRIDVYSDSEFSSGSSLLGAKGSRVQIPPPRSHATNLNLAGLRVGREWLPRPAILEASYSRPSGPSGVGRPKQTCPPTKGATFALCKAGCTNILWAGVPWPLAIGPSTRGATSYPIRAPPSP